jgi:hypothetical protein
MSVAMFGQDLRKIAKETIMEKLSEWSLPTNENYHKLKALGINADSLTYVKIKDISTTPTSPDIIIDSQKDTVIVKHYKVLGKEKADTINAVVCTGMKYVYYGVQITKNTTFFISNHYIKTYVIFDNQNNVIGVVMKVYECVFRGEYFTAFDLVSTIREFDNVVKAKKFCEIKGSRIVERKSFPHNSTESKDNKKKTKHRDNRVDDVY